MGAAVVALAVFHGVTREALGFTATGLALSSLDSLIVDAAFFGRLLWRRLSVYTRHPRARADRLNGPGAAFAIIVPAWDEAAVIGAMLRRLTETLDYPNYHVFVGIYSNDAATRATVAGIGDPRISLVTCVLPGPTTKADCLNHLWRAVVAHECTAGSFQAVVLHDAEDVVDPYELRVFDHLMPRLAMVQLPVEPLIDPDSPWIAGHYLDEFAEAHVKDVVAREGLGAAVPSAGVGCAIRRDVLARIADAAGGLPFDAACLTEDYELGLKVRALGEATALVRIARPGGGVVATREHFPGDLAGALRQKSRWLLGIALGGWDRLGWRGGLPDRLMLLRDRKGIAAALLTVAAYVVAALVLIDHVLAGLLPEMQRFAPLVAPDGWLDWTLRFTTAALVWRLVMRAGCTAHVYGWAEGLSALPRSVMANFINAGAAWGAMRRYIDIRRGAAIRWDKTEHRFPAE